MKCKNCGRENPPNSKFCSNCGAELKSDRKSYIYCGECGAKNKSTNKYCDNCGTLLNQGYRAKNVKREKRKNPSRKQISRETAHTSFIERNKLFSTAVVIVFGAFLFLLFNKGNNTNRSEFRTSGNQILAGFAGEKFLNVASKFTCACGECNDDLTDCSCPTANREKQMIQSQLQDNVAEIEIIKKINDEYGMLKPEYAGLLKGKNGGKNSSQIKLK